VVSYASGVTIANPIVLNSNDTQLEVAFGFATQAGAISETGGARPLEKIGNGALILTGINSYTGGTTISAGTLQLGTSGTQAALAGPITVAALPATLSIVNADVSGITSIVNNGLTEFLAGTTAGNIAITNNRTLDFSGNATAGNASITTGAASLTRFFDTSTAGNASIVNNDFVQLTETATTGAATVTRPQFAERCGSKRNEPQRDTSMEVCPYCKHKWQYPITAPQYQKERRHEQNESEDVGPDRPHVHQRRVHVFPDRELSGVWQAFAQRFQRKSGRGHAAQRLSWLDHPPPIAAALGAPRS